MKNSSLIVILGMAVFPMACADGGTGPAGANGVSLSFSTGGSGGSQPQLAASAAGQLTLTAVEIVLRQIELERADVEDCNVEPKPDGCEEFEVGPIAVRLLLDGSTEHSVSVALESGLYDEIEFEIHKVTDDAEDAAFRLARPDLVGKSVVATGTYGGVPFTYETDLDVEQELDLVPPLEVTGGMVNQNITVRVDVSTWFLDQSGNEINPADANKGGPFESIVNENIKRSIEAFEDDDGDGHEDHS